MKFSFLSLAAAAPLLISACLLPEEREGVRRRAPNRRQTGNGIPIGTGDRFSGGTIAPRGLGTQSTTIETLLNVDEIESGLQGLASVYNISTFVTPYKTYENATISGGIIGNSNDEIHVYLNGQIHARERGSAEGMLYFIGDLLYANENNIGLQYGEKVYTNDQVKKALSSGIVFTPLSNPDGVKYDYATNSCWRKNRNPASSKRSPGVDINRNFDFVWDLNRWTFDAHNNAASDAPGSEVFHGKGAFSEPESKAIKWVIDTYTKIRWFVDLHSTVGLILYSWGSDTNQFEYPYMNFMNTSYDSVRGDVGDTPGVGNAYGEYTPAAENANSAAAARRISTAMSTVANRTYIAEQSVDLYPTSGTSTDYAYSRKFVDSSLNLIYGFTIEFGFYNFDASCVFYPTEELHQKNINEIGAGLMEFLLAAVDTGLE